MLPAPSTYRTLLPLETRAKPLEIWLKSDFVFGERRVAHYIRAAFDDCAHHPRHSDRLLC
jgi:hypothetical protein